MNQLSILVKNQKIILINLFLIFLVMFLLVLPDIIFFIIGVLNYIPVNFKGFKFLIAIASSIVFAKSNKFVISLLIFFSILQTAQFINIKYFGTQLSVSSFWLMFKFANIVEIAKESSANWNNYLSTVPIVCIPFFSIYFINIKFNKYRFKSICGYLIFAYIFIFVTGKVFDDYRPKLQADIHKLTLYNSYLSFADFIKMRLINNSEIKNYIPYKITVIKDVKPKTIVYIIGESANYDHMSLFGFSEKTTPNLEKLSKESNFYYTKGISASYVTLSSTKYITNIVCEPDNFKQLASEETNLFKLAKMNGFKTFYICAKSNFILLAIGANKYIDVIINLEDYPDEFYEYSDGYLLTLAKKQEYTDKNFIVLHQRCIHAPYSDYLKFYNKFKRNGNEDNRISEYHNGMLFNDSVLYNLFSFFNKWKGDYYIIWASDHNEVIGEKKHWGHGILSLESARIPIMVQSNDKKFLNKIKEIFMPTHYEIGKLVAEQLGFIIENPNEKDNIFYINGVDSIGRCGYIKFQKDVKNKKVIELKDK